MRFANQSPLRKRNSASCHKLTARLERALPTNADSDAMIKIFRLPYVSLKKPHRCDVTMMPVCGGTQIFTEKQFELPTMIKIKLLERDNNSSTIFHLIVLISRDLIAASI